MTEHAVIDVGRLMDEGRWSPAQMVVVAFAALAIIFDGLDNQLLGVATPAILQEWKVTRAQLAPVLAAGIVGMTIGAVIGGLIGDRVGRRFALIGAVAIFGVLTLGIGFAHDLWTLGVLRFLVGVGLGAALPNAAAMASEFVPTNRRALAVTLTIVCVPLGGTLAGFIGAHVLPVHGWRTLFLIGGVMAIAVGALLLFVLPESPRFLAQRPSRWGELARTLKRFGHNISAGAAFVESAEGSDAPARASFRALLAPDHRQDTLLLWSAFFFCLTAVYSGFNWISSMLTAAGFDAATTGNGLAAFNLGGVAGAIASGLLIQRFGSRRVMLVMSAGAVLSALGALIIPAEHADSAALAILVLALSGCCINAVQTTSYALAAHIYPTNVRATGVGGALAIGRVGAILSSFVGAVALDLGGSTGFYLLIAVAMTLNFFSLAALRRHIAPSLP